MGDCGYGYDYDDEHKRFGYGRIEEFEKDKQRGFVFHERHMFLCYGDRGSWPGDFVLGDPESLPARLTCALKACQDKISRKTILTICEPSGDVCEGDVLIFPDMIMYSLLPSSVDSFITEVILNDLVWSGSPMVPLRKGSYVFVCAHGANAMTSGLCGQLVLETLNELIAVNQLEDKLFPLPCSDIGVPEFAANLIIFARDGKGKIDGHWYTYISPEDVPAILSTHLVGGLVSHHRWRGKMGNKKIMEIRAYPERWWWRGDDGSIDRIKDDGVQMVGWDWLRPEPAYSQPYVERAPLFKPGGVLTWEEIEGHLDDAYKAQLDDAQRLGIEIDERYRPDCCDFPDKGKKKKKKNKKNKKEVGEVGAVKEATSWVQ